MYTKQDMMNYGEWRYLDKKAEGGQSHHGIARFISKNFKHLKL